MTTDASPGPDPVEWRDVTVRYRYQDRDAVGPVSLTVRAGERLLLLGPSGSGKSTLLTTLTGLVPHTIPADVGGTISLFGAPVGDRSPAAWADTVAQLFQNAEQTLCGMTIGDEIAFALENRALPETEIAGRIDAAMAATGLPHEWCDRRTTALSGGEKQIVALAAALAQQAPIFVADEPTAHLSPEASARLRASVIDTDRRRSVIIVDHRLDELMTAVDRVAVLGRDGRLMAEGEPRRLFRDHGKQLAGAGIWRPAASVLDHHLCEAGIVSGIPPLTVDEALMSIDALAGQQKPVARGAVAEFVRDAVATASGASTDMLVSLESADCAPLFGPVVLRDVSLSIGAGEAVALLGGNGAGKSTLGATIAGLLRLKAGERAGPTGGIAFQNPENQFTQGSVLDEASAALPAGLAPEERRAAAMQALADWDLSELARAHPFELSQGQKRRLALLTLTVGSRWPLLVLDEPTAGLDAAGSDMVAALIERIRKAGIAVVLITHEMDFALKTCPRAIVLGEGGILVDGHTRNLLATPALLDRAGLSEPAVMPAIRWLERNPC